jgi:ABC-type uncharacterized transport system YnjBCD substrate-binding protein
MASQIQQNINISAGVSFTKQFTALNEDRSAKDLTGYTVLARMAKHSGAVDALKSTNDAPIWRYIDFTTSLVNATNGDYSITIPASTTLKLKEGKYVFSIVFKDASDNYTNVMEGLAFVDVAFAFTGADGSLDPNYP